MIERLTIVLDHNGDPAYAETNIRAVATHVLELSRGGLLAVRETRATFWVEFAVFQFLSGPGEAERRAGAPTLYAHVFHGEGPSGSLRELRHTYWGEASNSGYIFYPSGALIADAFAKLQRWFNCGMPKAEDGSALGFTVPERIK